MATNPTYTSRLLGLLAMAVQAGCTPSFKTISGAGDFSSNTSASSPITPSEAAPVVTPGAPPSPATTVTNPVTSNPPDSNANGSNKVQDLPGPTMNLTAPSGQAVRVASSDELTNAMNAANAGDVITITPGTYLVSNKLRASAIGSANQRIYLRADRLGDVVIQGQSPEVVLITGKYWTFENLKIVGVCPNHSDCDNIFHIVGDSSDVIIRNNRLLDYNAPYKGNADKGGDPSRKYPHDILIEHNLMQHSQPRVNDNPTNGVNIDGGIRWTVRANAMVDIARTSSDSVSYAGFMKANGKDSTFERNLVICQKHTTGGTRVGLSIGGGGAVGNPAICDFNPPQNGQMPEWNDAIVRNNLLINCNGTGFYNNNGWNTRLSHNTFYKSPGVQSRFAAGNLVVTNNVINAGNITNRDGGASTDNGNIFIPDDAGYSAYFQNPEALLFSLQPGANRVRGEASILPDVTDDICGVARGNSNRDMGAFNSDTNPDCAIAIQKIYQSY